MESKYLKFHFLNYSGSGKTKVYQVWTKEDLAPSLLGYIKWFGAWRCYAFYPASNTVFEKTCLQDITNFIIKLINMFAGLGPLDSQLDDTLQIFTVRMEEKLAAKAKEGLNSWASMTKDQILAELQIQLDRTVQGQVGGEVDIANYAMFLWHLHNSKQEGAQIG